MTSFIHYKKKKIEHVFRVLGVDVTEAEFISTFKSLYPEDWQKIQEKWLIVSSIFRKFIFPLGNRQLPGQRMRLCIYF